MLRRASLISVGSILFHFSHNQSRERKSTKYQERQMFLRLFTGLQQRKDSSAVLTRSVPRALRCSESRDRDATMPRCVDTCTLNLSRAIAPHSVISGLSSYIYVAIHQSGAYRHRARVSHTVIVLRCFPAMHLLCLVGFALLELRVSEASDWGYWGEYGPENWPGECTVGKKQSPINIVTDDVVRIDLGALKFDRYDFAFSGSVINNGHTVQIRLDGVPIHLSGGNLPSAYILEQMHFHWGAEHTIDGSRDPLELHFVHYSEQYTNFSVAAEHQNGVVVVAVLFELSNYDNPELMPIVKATEMVSNWVGKSTIKIRKKLIPQAFLPKDHTTYYHYLGSLTTPGCQESVMWYIMTEKLTVSEAQMEVFKRVMTHNDVLKFNYRPTQKIGKRKVYHRLDGYSNASSFNSNIFSSILSVFLVRLLHSIEDF